MSPNGWLLISHMHLFDFLRLQQALQNTLLHSLHVVIFLAVRKVVFTGLEIRGILVANATMFSQLLPGFSSGREHLLLP